MIITAVFGGVCRHCREDWHALYIDEKLFHQGHDIPIWVWVEAINRCEETSAREWLISHLVLADTDWLTSVGRYPEHLDDVLSFEE